MAKISKILVPVDLSSCSRSALNQALSLARELRATIQILHVTELPRFHKEPKVASEGGNVPLREYALAEARAELSAFLEPIPAGEREKLATIIEAGSPRESILGHAKRDGYDLIVMGTHGRTGRVHALAGSVAESVVRMAPCPVLTVRDAG
ncbi:MAG TPA: universal stress protein [Polyangiaceae bacterium]|nr:universal stress protein [Polyangiaceae bacterium]